MKRVSGVVVAAAIVSAVMVGVGGAMQFTPWSQAVKIDEIAGNHVDVNTSFLDGCPIESPDGLSLYIASNRPRFSGDTRTDLDIWVATRETTSDGWGAPVNLGSPINTTADDFCPTPVRGNGLFFVSRKVIPGVTCGLGDMYFTRRNPKHGWSEPAHLGCTPAGPNSELDEQGPSYVEAGGQRLLFFSRSRAPAQGGLVNGDIFVSEALDGDFGPASLVSGGVNSTGNDIQPNVRKDGLELVFSSNHAHVGAQGSQDLYVATRSHVDEPWSAPVNLGSAVNTSAAETRPSLSWHASQLLFGRAPGVEGTTLPIQSDIYVSTRDKAND